jgi:tight adherence protein B
MIYLILSFIIGVSCAVLVWVIFVVEKDLSPNTLRRLERIKRKSNITEEEATEELDLSAQDLEYKIEFFEKIFSNIPIFQEIGKLIQLADVDWYIDTFILISFLCASPFLLFLFTPFKLMAALALLTFFIPTMYLNRLVDKRFFDFSKQFPDALNLMASSLRAGHPLFSAIDIVVSEMPKPISDIFDTARKDISLGRDTKDAFYRMTTTIPKSLDLRLFVTAVLIQKEVGGNLAELLDKLSETIRERFKLLGQLRVATAQTRISGTILAIVPIGVFLIIFFMNPEYIKPLFETQDGKIAFGLAIFLTVAGILSIRKISQIEM